jgi:competence protein ComEC
VSATAFQPAAAFAPVLAGVVLGSALQLQQPSLWPVEVYAIATVAGLVGLVTLLRVRLYGWWTRPALCAAAMLVFAALTGLRAAIFSAGALAPSLEGRDLEVTGIVSALPQRNEAGLRFRFRVESATLAGQPVRLPPGLMLGWYVGVEPRGDGGFELERQPATLRPGERWIFTVRLKAPHGHVNPHGFDYELWLWEQGVQATGYVRAGPRDRPPRRIEATALHPVEQARERVREAIFARVPDPRRAGVLAALVVGDQAAIERAEWDVFRATGVAHLMSISGLHVTMFGWAAGALVLALWRRSARLCLSCPAQQAALVAGVAVAAAYALFSGWGVPAQRTVCMMGIVALLRLGARDWPWPWVWLLVCAGVVALDPWALTQPGFWLSFVAVGVLFATGPAGADSVPRPRWARALHAARAMLHEQWVVTLALTPLSVLLFGQVSLVGLLANVVAIPWVTLVVTPLGLAGAVAPPLWDLAALGVEGLAVLLAWLADFPLATWSAPAPPVWAGAAGVAGGLLLAARLPWPVRALGLPLLLPVLLWQAPRPPLGEFELLAADVGQGNAVIVRTAGHTLVYDAGPGYSRDADAGQRVLVPLLRAWGERVDLLMLSHRDIDHTGGAAAVLRMQADARLSSSLEAAHPLHDLRAPQRCHAGQRWEWDGVAFEVLHPAAQAYQAAARPNALSCVLAIGNGRARALLAGDIERPQEAALVERDAAALRADVLLVPHHGSKTSSTEAFLAAVGPGTALVQAGYRNRFGHPAPEVVQRYRTRGIALVTSAHCGAAAWNSREPATVRCERQAAPRYWRHRP